jgi:CubicO group peptidase (beta-lactamase class C family)
LPADNKPIGSFICRTVYSEVLGWIVTTVTNKHWADLMAERIWHKPGTEEDAHVMADSAGTPQQGAGLNAAARDLARFGEMPRRKRLVLRFSLMQLGLKATSC